MPNATIEQDAHQANQQTGVNFTNSPFPPRPGPDPKPEVMLSPKEEAAIKVYSTLEEIMIDSTKYEKEIETLRARPVWLDIVFGVGGGGIGFLSLLVFAYFNPKFSSLLFQLIASLTLGLMVFAIRIASRQGRIASLQAGLEILEVRKRSRSTGGWGVGKAGTQLSSQIPPAGEYFDQLVGINVKNLGDYYGLVRLHNDKSFRVSVAAGVVGFILIAAAVGLALLSTGSEKLSAAISAGSGVITEFIGAVFFYLYNRSVREMGAYFKSLLDVQNILLSLKLVNDTKDDKEKVKMVGMMISYLVGRQRPDAKGFPASLAEEEQPQKTQASEPKTAERAAAAKASG